LNAARLAEEHQSLPIEIGHSGVVVHEVRQIEESVVLVEQLFAPVELFATVLRVLSLSWLSITLRRFILKQGKTQNRRVNHFSLAHDCIIHSPVLFALFQMTKLLR